MPAALVSLSLAAACGSARDMTLLERVEDPASAPTTQLGQPASITSGPAVDDSFQSDDSAHVLTVDPMVARRRLAEACSFGSAAAAGSIARQPYLQNVSAGSAVVVFTTGVPGIAPTLRLAQPGNAAQRVLASEPDPADASGAQRLVRLDGLEPDNAYCYQVEGSPAAGFRTPPLAGTGAGLRFVAFGDSGGPSAEAVADAMAAVPFDLMLHTGDIAYQTGTLPDFEQEFFAPFADLIATAPIFPASGNHDYVSDDAATFRQVFALPENGAPAGLERWYSFDWGDVHFVALDTERVNADQIAWLERDLAQNTLPWTVAYLHRPPHSSGRHGGSPPVLDAFSPLFEAHGVQLVLSGHEHDYERTRMLEGVTYVVTGGGGYSVRSVGMSDFTALSASLFHFVHVEVHADELTLRAIDTAGEVFDEVTIARAPGGG